MAKKQGKSNIPYLLGTAILGGLVSIAIRARRDQKSGKQLPQWAEELRRNRKNDSV